MGEERRRERGREGWLGNTSGVKAGACLKRYTVYIWGGNQGGWGVGGGLTFLRSLSSASKKKHWANCRGVEERRDTHTHGVI